MKRKKTSPGWGDVENDGDGGEFGWLPGELAAEFSIEAGAMEVELIGEPGEFAAVAGEGGIDLGFEISDFGFCEFVLWHLSGLEIALNALV